MSSYTLSTIMPVNQVGPARGRGLIWLVGVKVEHTLNKVTVHEVVSFGRELQAMFPML